MSTPNTLNHKFTIKDLTAEIKKRSVFGAIVLEVGNAKTIPNDLTYGQARQCQHIVASGRL